MTSAAAATIGRTARIVLLLCTVFGVAMMHTLGHSGVRPEHSSAAAMTTMLSTVAIPALAPSAATDECQDDHCTGHHHDQMTVWSVCLAILGGLAVVVLLVMVLVAAAHPGSVPRSREWSRRQATRAPPTAGAGLILVLTAVLRV
ncbi:MULTISPECIES: DUF6153 family protein [unclassified Actinoplanes]|uniref:DUF6153 family protein n=1 Tax=unclassified Actinoplanes TaxID=2626549 RepID=UPI0012BB0395|nr:MULTISPECIES: DUF6153 family protein [unclassified Actinoplanes]